MKRFPPSLIWKDLARWTLQTPESILHFKTACGLLDEQTIFADKALSDTGCFAGFNVIYAPAGEQAAANLIRVNDFVLVDEPLVSSGYPETVTLLEKHGTR